MKLKNLKTGQRFKFAKGYKKDKGPFIVLSPYPKLEYKVINGRIHHRPTTKTIPESEVILVGEPVETQLQFTDPDGDTVTFDTNIESDFMHVCVKYTFNDEQNVAISGLNRDDVVKLISYLENQLLIKD